MTSLTNEIQLRQAIVGISDNDCINDVFSLHHHHHHGKHHHTHHGMDGMLYIYGMNHHRHGMHDHRMHGHGMHKHGMDEHEMHEFGMHRHGMHKHGNHEQGIFMPELKNHHHGHKIMGKENGNPFHMKENSFAHGKHMHNHHLYELSEHFDHNESCEHFGHMHPFGHHHSKGFHHNENIIGKPFHQHDFQRHGYFMNKGKNILNE